MKTNLLNLSILNVIFFFSCVGNSVNEKGLETKTTNSNINSMIEYGNIIYAVGNSGYFSKYDKKSKVKYIHIEYYICRNHLKHSCSVL